MTKVYAAVLCVLVLVLQYRIWWSDDGVSEAFRLREAVAEQRATNEQLRRRNEQLAAEVADLKGRLAAIRFSHFLRGIGFSLDEDCSVQSLLEQQRQPLEVIRSLVSFKGSITMSECIRSVWLNKGWRGFFIGFVPRLCRKPINSGICWTILESVKEP